MPSGKILDADGVPQPRCEMCGKPAPETANKHARGFPWTSHRCVPCCESSAFETWENFDRAANGRWGHLSPDPAPRWREPRFEADDAQRVGD